MPESANGSERNVINSIFNLRRRKDKANEIALALYCDRSVYHLALSFCIYAWQTTPVFKGKKCIG